MLILSLRFKRYLLLISKCFLFGYTSPLLVSIMSESSVSAGPYDVIVGDDLSVKHDIQKRYSKTRPSDVVALA